MDSKPEISLLYDFYKELLNQNQQQVIELYVNDDLSLSETADILGISRQGVRDAVNRTEKKLRDYESKLHMLSDYQARFASIMRILSNVGAIRELSDNDQITVLCDRITDNIRSTIKKVEREEQHGV